MSRAKLIFTVGTLILLPFIVRYQYFVGLRQQVPLGFFANIQHGGEFGPGRPTNESHIGLTAQALGTQAAHRWWSGHVPLWNYYEGTGVPLAGEMQSAALFLPFILLLKTPDGQLYFHISLQIIAGLSTFFFLRRLRLVPAAAFCGAVFFELNGTYAWMANAAYNPVAFLPLSLLGVECLIDSAQRGDRGGWTLLCAGAAWSVYAGFPEVAFLNAIFVVLYTLVRLTQLPAFAIKRSALKLVIATVITLLLIGPALAEFLDYLSFSYQEGRGHLGGFVTDPRLGVGPLVVPYIFGPPGCISTPYWGKAAGYLGYTLTVLSLAAIIWLWRNRIVQFCATWAILCLLKIYGEPHVNWAVLKLPLMSFFVFERWLMPSLEFACVVLTAMAIHELFAGRRARLLVPGLIGASVVCLALYGLYNLDYFWLIRSVPFNYPTLNLLFVVNFTLTCIGAVWLGRAAPWMIAGFGLFEAFCLFNVPIFSAPRHCQYDMEGIAFLQNHIGLQRFYTLGPIQPNYGSAFNLAELNYDDMPISRYLVDYFKDHLDPYRNATNTKPDWQRNGHPMNIDIIRQNYRAYAEAGVKYVLTEPDEQLNDLFPEVYSSSVMRVYELPDVRPYFSAECARIFSAKGARIFSAEGAGVHIEPLDRDRVKIRCDRPTPLVRLESYSPNWKAYIDGRPVPVWMYEKLFQAVDLPAGEYLLTFDYESPYGSITMPLFWTGAMLFALVGLLEVGSALCWRQDKNQL